MADEKTASEEIGGGIDLLDFLGDATPDRSTAEPEPQAGEEPAAPAKEAEATASEPAPEAPAAEPSPEKPEPAPPPAPPKADSEVAQLKAQLEAQQTQNRILSEQLQTRAKAPAAEPAPERNFNLAIPDQIIEGMQSEDPRVRQRSLEALVNGTAEAVHKKVSEDYKRYFQETFNKQFSTVVEAQNEAQRVSADFYGKYPEFNKPELRNVVRAVASQIAAEIGATEWSDNLRDLVGTRLRAMAAAQVAGAPPPAPGAAPKPKLPPKAVGQGARPAPPQKSGSDEVADVLGL